MRSIQPREEFLSRAHAHSEVTHENMHYRAGGGAGTEGRGIRQKTAATKHYKHRECVAELRRA